MIPLRDENPSRTRPVVMWTLVALNLGAFLYELMLGPDLRGFTLEWGLVPARLSSAMTTGSEPVLAAGLPLLTSMFLHGGWMHLIGNLWYLVIFGDNVEDRLGHGAFLFFYLAAGLAGGLLHYYFNAGSAIPTVGASGAIAGVMGAYFLLFPTARVLTVVPIIFMFVWLPAWLVLGYWFLAQFLSGAATSISASSNMGGVAFWAHVGGFVAGITLIKIFPPRQRPYSYGQ